MQVFNTLVASGINLFDTADSYGGCGAGSLCMCACSRAGAGRLAVPLACPCCSPPHPRATGTGKLEGRSEQLLGQFLAEYPGSPAARDSVRIATKLAAYPWRLTPGQWVSACRASLKRSGQEKLALAQVGVCAGGWVGGSVCVCVRVWVAAALLPGCAAPALTCPPA